MTRGVFVTGATGFLGRHLLGALRAARVPTLAHVRDRAAWPYHGESFDRVALVEGELLSDAWRAALSGHDVAAIVHAAGIVQHTRRAPAAMTRFHVDSAEHVVRTAHAIGARVVLISSSGTVGFIRPARGAPAEHAPYAEATIARWPYYASKMHAERAARRLADQLGVALAIVRLPVLLGPGDHRRRSTGHVARVLAGRVPFVPTGGIAFTDVRDAAAAITQICALARPRPIYHLPGTTASLAAFFQMVGEVANVAITRRRAPRWLLGGLARIGRTWPVPSLPDPVLLEMAQHHWGVSSLWSHRELGYAPRAARQTLADTVGWLRQHPA